MTRFNAVLLYSSMVLLAASIGLRIVVSSKYSGGYPEQGTRISFEEIMTQNGKKYKSSADTTIVIAYNMQCGTCQSLAPSWKWIAEEILETDGVDIVGLSQSSSDEIASYKEAFSLPFSTLIDEKGKLHRESRILEVPQIIWLYNNIVVKALNGVTATDILIEQYLNTDYQE